MNYVRLVHLLKPVKALSVRQRKRLVRAILFLDERLSEAPPARKGEAQVVWPDIEVRGKRITGDRLLPNLVLLDRGEETTTRTRAI